MKTLSLLAATLLTACFPTPAEENTDRQKEAQLTTDRLFYTKDFRTGLCFASKSIGYNSALLTNIPCTETVEALVGANK